MIFSAVDFIAAITQHIPEKNFQLVRYYGWYSNRMRGDRRKREQAGQVEEIVALVEGIEIIDVADYRPCTTPSPTWRECIKKIWEVDLLECPKCHGEMKIISFITDSPTIRKILLHLKLWERPPPGKSGLEATNDADQYPDLIYEPFDDGWPGYEEPVTATW